MPIEAALIKPVVDALLALFRQGSDIQLKRNAEAALREAIRELLMANPDENRAEARIAIARAAGILSEDIVLAEDMLKKHRATKSRTAGKSATGRKRKPAAAAADVPAKPAPARKRAVAKAPAKATGATTKGDAAAKPAARSSSRDKPATPETPPAPGKPARPTPKG
ncbi:hypothetical protein [Luteimonas sp. MC1572]|uniref:hypothetical protein n=1 Tax=Luteimonas sp. MC1572 TaxID=2799325 RepID=UPI0018F0858A|nr:hypothetical protein [Luteimonas sp. MC1572]MBJ6982100.1 hypothetical protein [Luteimonas sp. MC1572]QQO03394.1 hypothetical protein JGR64_00995 [Luteimonas sp. MC1572]